MPKRETGKCPVCRFQLVNEGQRGGHSCFDCHRCGRFCLTYPAAVNLAADSWPWTDREVTILGHRIRRMQSTEQEWPLIDAAALERIKATGSLPTVQEQADNLIRWLGEGPSGPGEMVTIGYLGHGAIVGAHTVDGFVFVVRGLIDTRLLTGSLTGGAGGASVTLTFAGWARFEELRLGAPSGRNAFMAMPYGEAILDRLVDGCFRPAVKQTGFDLQRFDDNPPAGLIDDRMRVQIQGSRFLIADMTHRNPGAYWEAGYAEGLGKPVIYTCEKAVFEKTPSHFDTNHHLHVFWEEEDLAAVAPKLKATIRATIPEATREDPEDVR